MIVQLLKDPKNIFLIDGAGAILSFVCLYLILPYFIEYIGLPVKVLHLLAIAPAVYFIYDFFCYKFIKKNLSFYLTIIGLLNVGYCFFSLNTIYPYWKGVTMLGKIYFLIEIIIVGAIGAYEIHRGMDLRRLSMNQTSSNKIE